MEECGKCNGEGQIECPLDYDNDWHPQYCPSCSGDNWILCPDCRGSGSKNKEGD